MATIDGDGSDNSINGTPDADNITGGGGSDTINAGAGDDVVFGDDGDNAIPNGSLVYHSTTEAFDSGAAGWVPGGSAPGTGFEDLLGRVVGTADAGDIEASRSFNLDTSYSHAIVEFDFHRIDSWDNEAFQIYSGGTQIFSQSFYPNTTVGGSNTVTVDGVTYTVTLTSLGDAAEEGYWISGADWTYDQSFRVRIEVENAPATLDIGLGSTLNQGVDDETYSVSDVAVVSTDDTSIDIAPFINADDTIYGGDGNDTIHGEEGADILSGDAGDDTIYGGDGADSIFGGDDSDTIYGASGDVIDGGEGGVDNDTLIINDPGAIITPDAGNPENGTVTFSDSTTLTYTNIENVVIPCFTPGTSIKTSNGHTKVEDLKVGDLVETYDNGLQPIRWVGRKQLSAADLAANACLRPIKIRAGSLGIGNPCRDMRVSPQHRLMLGGFEAQLLFGEDEVLVKAKDLLHKPGVARDDAACVTYIHIMFDQHEIILADNTWTESFQPGDMLGDDASVDIFEELLTLFPELANRKGRRRYCAARMSLKQVETRLVS